MYQNDTVVLFEKKNTFETASGDMRSGTKAKSYQKIFLTEFV
jgi:hypothetical protein